MRIAEEANHVGSFACNKKEAPGIFPCPGICGGGDHGPLAAGLTGGKKKDEVGGGGGGGDAEAQDQDWNG